MMRARHILLTCLALGAASGAGAQSPAFAPTAHPSATGARGAVTADFNRDGWLDVATANIGRNTVAILLNRGAAGGFLAPRETTVSAGPFDLSAGDLNRDGIPDLAVAAPDGAAIDLLTVGPDGYVRSRQVFPTDGDSRGVLLADVTRDGHVDLIYSVYSRNLVVLHVANGTGGFFSDSPYAVSARPQGLAAGDFNHDGRMDVAVASTGSTSLNVLYGASSGFTRRVFSAGRTLNVLTAADLDADGWADIAAASTATNVVSVFKGSASGFTLAGTRPTGSSPRGIASGDFNQDGRPDLAVGNRSSNSVSVLLARSGSVLPDRWGDLPSSTGARAVVTGDFDHDGRMDIAAGGETDARLMLHTNDTAFVAPAFSFNLQPVHNPSGNESALVVADFNENGRPDLVAGRDVWLDGTTRGQLAIASNASVRDVAAGDINRDGHLDLAVAMSWFDAERRVPFEGASLWFGDGTGGFREGAGLGGLIGIQDIRLADMDRDGTLDVVATGFGSGVGKLHVIRQRDGGWHFDTIAMESFARGLAVEDVNRDGILDILTSHYQPQILTIRLGDGKGVFGIHNVSLPSGGDQFELGDFDHNGLPDVVMAGDRTVMVILASAVRGWEPPVEYPVSVARPRQSAGQVRVVDFNHDGHLDIFTVTGSLLHGDGTGTFGAPVEFEVYMWGGVVADWNRDGLVDFIGPVSLMLNERRTENRAPVANAGEDVTLSYSAPFHDDGEILFSEASTDPDAHALQFEWLDPEGRIISISPIAHIQGRPPGTYTFTLTVRDGRGGEDQDTVDVTILPYPEIVLHTASQFSTGNWQQVQDSTAASGSRLFYPNANAAKVTTPLADPPGIVSVYFTPDPTQTYKLWVRLKAQNNAAGNDSVWLQFSGAVDAAGTPAYRIGTTEGLPVNLEECSGCGISGWGWEDDGWGARDRNGVTLRFPEGGPQSIQIQVREDGVSVDQIVLSAMKYRTTRPGTAKNDTVILQATQGPPQ